WLPRRGRERSGGSWASARSRRPPVRLASVEHGHAPAVREHLDRQEAEVGHLDGMDMILGYRPELFGDAFRAVTEAALTGPSEWGPGDRELLAALVSAENQCPF